MTDIKAGTLHVDLAGDTSDLKKSLQDAEKDLKGFDSKVSESVMSLGEMKREFRTLSKMSMVGKTPQEVEATTKRMAFLKDAIGDTNNTIKSLSLDPFQKLAETVQVGSTVMGGLAGATSLLGGDQERLNELMQKTVALIAISNAAQEASVFFQERSAGIWLKNKTLEISTRLKEILTIGSTTTAAATENAVKSKGNLITQAITKAQWLWNAAVAANPIGLLIAGIAALSVGIGVLAVKLTKNTEQFDEAKKSIASLNAEIERNNSFSKLQSEIQDTLGKNQQEKNKTRKKQIDDEIELTNKLIEKSLVLSQETGFFGKETKEAKEANDNLKNLYNRLIELGDEKSLLDLQDTVNSKKRVDEIESMNKKLEISLLEGKQKEIAELNLKYAEDLKNWKDSKETQKLLTQKYAIDLANINANYANQAKRKHEEEFLIQAVPKIINPETKDLYLKSKTEIPEQKIIAPVSLSFLVKKIDTKEIETSLIDVSDMLGSVVTQGLNDMAVGISETIGEMAAGNAGMDDLFKNMLESIGSFMQTLGKSLIAAGIGAIAFESLLEEPAAAIAAGAALVALGAMVKSTLAKGPSGSGSSYSSGVSSGGGSGNFNSSGLRDLRNLEITVNGTIKTSGRDLAVVLNNEGKRTAL